MKFEVKPKKQVRLGQVGIGSKRKSHYICKLKIQAKPIRKSQAKPIRKSQANLKKSSQSEKAKPSRKNKQKWSYLAVENMSSLYTGRKCVRRKYVRR